MTFVAADASYLAYTPIYQLGIAWVLLCVDEQQLRMLYLAV